jgi:PAS domain S-box-containing protein
MPDPVSRGRILVIDDQKQTRYVFRRILTYAGYTVEEAKTASEGLAKALSSPDIIIADVNLPDMLGYDLCRRLKANSLTAGIPVLQISASFISDESKVQALQGGADSYLTQPVEPTVLLAQIQALLRLKRAEALSSLSARHWQTTFDSLTDGIALVDSSGVILRVNRAFLSLLEITHSEAEGQPVANLFATCFGIPFAEYLTQRVDGRPTELAFSESWLRVRYDEVQADPLQSSGAILLLADVTEHKKLQETLKMSERLAATGRLAHIIAHEINNPLEAMSNLLYLIEQNPSLDETARSYLSQASLELHRISQITKQVLAYHRESKEPLPARVDEVLSGVLAMFRLRMSASSIELITRFDSSRVIEINPGEIRQAFGNLIANALDAIGSGGTLRVRCFNAIDCSSGVEGVRFVFSDSGAGIPEHISPRIFGAFYTTKDLEGSGIGLWLTSEVVSKHNGRIRVRSRTEGPYRGTLFDVFLPARLSKP